MIEQILALAHSARPDAKGVVIMTTVLTTQAMPQTLDTEQFFLTREQVAARAYLCRFGPCSTIPVVSVDHITSRGTEFAEGLLEAIRLLRERKFVLIVEPYRLPKIVQLTIVSERFLTCCCLREPSLYA